MPVEADDLSRVKCINPISYRVTFGTAWNTIGCLLWFHGALVLLQSTLIISFADSVDFICQIDGLVTIHHVEAILIADHRVFCKYRLLVDQSVFKTKP